MSGGESSGPIGHGSPGSAGGVGPAATAHAGVAAPPAEDAWRTWWRWNREWFLERTSLASGPVSGDSSGPSVGLDPVVVRTEIVPILVRELSRGTDATLRTSTLLALAWSGSAPTEQAAARLEESLSHASRATTEAAFLGLGRFGESEGVRLLAKVLDDENARLGHRRVTDRARVMAVVGLVEAALQSRNEDLRRYVVSTLVRRVAAEKGEPHVSSSALLGLCVLAEAEPSTNAICRTFVPDPWGWFGSTDLDLRARVHVARLAGALSREPDELARLALEALEASQPMPLEWALVQLLGQLGPLEDVLASVVSERLEHFANEGSPAVRGPAWIALGMRADVERLSAALEDAGLTEEPWIALALGLAARRAGSEEAGELIDARLESASRSTASAWALAAGIARREGVVSAVASRLEQSDLRGDAEDYAWSLGLCGSRRAIAPLHALARRCSHQARALEAVAIALDQLQDSGRASLLLEGLVTACCVHASTAHLRALTRIGDKRLVRPMLELVVDDDAREIDRAWGMQVLGGLMQRGRRTPKARFGHGLNYEALLSSLSAPDSPGALDLR